MATGKHRKRGRKAVYPGSFDPVTNGHLALIRKAAALFDSVDVAVGTNTSKTYTFSVSERISMLQQATRSMQNVRVAAFDGLVVTYAKARGIRLIIRGLRAISDYEHEMQMALVNRKLNPNIETVFLLPSEEYFYLSSGLVKEIARLGGRVHDFVPVHVERTLRSRFSDL